VDDYCGALGGDWTVLADGGRLVVGFLAGAARCWRWMGTGALGVLLAVTGYCGAMAPYRRRWLLILWLVARWGSVGSGSPSVVY